MGSTCVSARTGAARSDASNAATPGRPRLPIARPRPRFLLRARRSGHVQDVSAPEPERTRDLPLDQVAERERGLLGLPAPLLPKPDDAIARVGRPATSHRDGLYDAHRPAQREAPGMDHLTQHEHL